MNVIEISNRETFIVAIAVLFLGKWLTAQIDYLRRNNIPEPVTGGVIATVLVWLLGLTLGIELVWTLDTRDLLLIARHDGRFAGSIVISGGTHLRWFTQKSMIELFEDQGYEVIQQKGINASKSLKPRLMNLLMLGGASDMKYMQFATVAVLK